MKEVDRILKSISDNLFPLSPHERHVVKACLPLIKYEVSRWIPVGERLPYNGKEDLPPKLKPVLTWAGDNISTAVYIPKIGSMAAKWRLSTAIEALDDSDYYWTDWVGNLPTHWQDLPQPPKGK